MPASAIETVEFLGIDFAVLTPAATLDAVLELSAGPGFAYVATPNVDHIVRLEREKSRPGGAALRAAYVDAALCVCDSRVLAALARLRGLRLPVVTGSDLTEALIMRRLPARARARAAVIGGTASQLAWLASRFPAVEWSQHIPPMGLQDRRPAQEAAIQFVEAAGAQFVFFAVGSPQSELLAAEIRRRGRSGGVGLCIGASIEFLTGAKRRAPVVMRRMGFEWAFRLAVEPGRLWRRYCLDGPKVFWIWLNWRPSRVRRPHR